MHRVHPKELLAIPPEDSSKLEALNVEEEERQPVTTFSWNLAVSLFQKKVESRVGRADIYFLDGRLILNDAFLESVTEEICQEYGLDLLDVIADLVLPVGFRYPSLMRSLPEIVDDAFKPVSKRENQKVILWLEDEHWNNPERSIMIALVQHLLLSNVEPYMIAPCKYFDKEVMASFTRRMYNSAKGDDGTGESNVESREEDVPSPEDIMKTFGLFVKFGFLLALRSSLRCPLIILHFGQQFSDMIDAFQLLDLAEAEGHEIKYLKNTAANPADTRKIVTNFVTLLKDVPTLLSPKKRLKRSRIEPETVESHSRTDDSDSVNTSAATEKCSKLNESDLADGFPTQFEEGTAVYYD